MQVELKRFIALLTHAEEVNINYISTTPDIDDFFNPHEDDVLILLTAKVEVGIRASELPNVKTLKRKE